MPINQSRLQTKLLAIQNKDIDQIMSQMPYLPRLGNQYTRTQVENWLNKVAKVLTDAQSLSDAQINNLKTTIYNQLSASDKLIADKINSGENYSLDEATTDAHYDRLVALVLIKFLTE